ncbi:calcium-binding protein, partial [Lyngbya sp. CCY1209]|nr:calcium-binding protein [Lyngbya sp. CCY1209]
GSDVIVFNRSTEDGFGFVQIGETSETLDADQFINLETGTYQDSLITRESPILAYEQETGTLKYDPDGSGDAPAEIVAIFNNSPFLSINDILLAGASTISPPLPVSETVTAFAVVNGTEESNVIFADDPPNFTGITVTVPVPPGSTITELVGGTVTSLSDNGTSVEFTPTVGGGNTGSFEVF